MKRAMPRTIRVGTYNVRHALDRVAERRPLLRETLRSADCDIWGVQEAITGGVTGPDEGRSLFELGATLGASTDRIYAQSAVLAYATAVPPLAWLVALPVVQWLLAAAASFNELFLEWFVRRHAGPLFYHPIGQLAYALLGTAFCFGNAIAVLRGDVHGRSLLRVGKFRVAQRVIVELRGEGETTPPAEDGDDDSDSARSGRARSRGRSRSRSTGRRRNRSGRGARGASPGRRTRGTPPDAARRICFLNVHLASAPSDVDLRAKQVEAIIDWLAPLEGDVDGFVWVGDWNARPDEAAIALAKESGWRSAYQEAHGAEPASTFPTGLQAVSVDHDVEVKTLDYIMVKGDVSVAGARVIGDEPHPDDGTLFPSDHAGLVADLIIA